MIIFRIKFEFEVHTCTYKFCKSADLKFLVSGRVRNAVMLVWGSLRLTPIIYIYEETHVTNGELLLEL